MGRDLLDFHPQRPAVRLDNLMITYAQLDDLSARAAHWLRERGTTAGDRVGIMLPNVAQFPVSTTACCGTGHLLSG